MYFLSADHRRLSLDAVARLSAAAPRLGPDLMSGFALRGALVLATCNRLALLLEADELDASAIARFLARRAGLDQPPELSSWQGAEAHRELFATASGLRSMVIGERQIAGQLRRALRTATAEATASTELIRAVEHASIASRRVAGETSLAGRGRSIVAVGVGLAERELGPLPGARVLLVGTGSYAGATVSALREHGATSIAVHSASSQRGQDFARSRGLRAVAPEALAQALAQADLVITCRGMGGPILSADRVRQALEARSRDDGTRTRLVILDLALPRDVEAGVAELPGVVCLDLDGIRQAVPAAAGADIEQAQAIVEAEAGAFERDLAGRAMAPLITAVRAAADRVVEEEAARLRPAGETDSVSLAEAERALQRLAARLLHVPTVQARRAGEAGQQDAYRQALALVLGPDLARAAHE
ncbi:glutamyl-tRNA reductase [Actinomyces slackii]|uniref:Glutamyl-tRNA reductase n=1 Tax=Actinomyces slackii TaxID=52774 RepID=A0A448KA76_9ACTO|nr:glutamyl-tRNA reductase [Actinomyces slackii]VEG73813.1 Glutamyl-tRNA reductase [Actinomyces slackii]